MCAWFSGNAKCPIDEEKRLWIDRRWSWLETEFGLERLRKSPVILPEPEFFPDEFLESIEHAVLLFDRVCCYMQIERREVELSFYEEHRAITDLSHGTAGLYDEQEGRFVVAINVANLADGPSLVATMAHELAHIHLLGRKRLSPAAADHEPLTDLLTVYMGLGVFTANSVIREGNWHQVEPFGLVTSGWAVQRQGYLSMPMYGYALAQFAVRRGDDASTWADYLRPDVRSPFNQALRYLATRPLENSIDSSSEPISPPGDVASRNEPDPFDDEAEGAEEVSDLEEDSVSRLVRRYAQGERNFAHINLGDARLSGVQLAECDLTDAYLSDADLSGADLRGANLERAELERVNLTGANLQGANLRGALLTQANLTGADLSRADLRNANFERAILRKATLLDVVRDGDTDFLDADLTETISAEELVGLRFEHLASYVAGALLGAVPGFALFGWLGLTFVGEIFGRGLGICAAVIWGCLVPYGLYLRDRRMLRAQVRPE